MNRRGVPVVGLVMLPLLAWCLPASGQTYTYTHFAGSTGGPGYFDGTGTNARFAYPDGIVRDAAGNYFIADAANNTIRRMTPSREVTTFAGLPGVSGSADGVGESARFCEPSGLAYDGAGNLYVAEARNQTIRRIHIATRSVTTVAGLAGQAGSTDGVGSAARFREPRGITLDASGHAYVADSGNHTIRKIVLATRAVTTIAGQASATGTADGIGSAARFYFPYGLTCDGAGRLFIMDTFNRAIRQLFLASNLVTTFAGVCGSGGSADGFGSAARFDMPVGITFDGSGNLFVSDYFTVRKIVVATAQVSTVAGTYGQAGCTDGFGSAARFNTLWGLAWDGSSAIVLADSGNHSLRRVVPATTQVTTVAGEPAEFGSADGVGQASRFTSPWGIAADGAGSLYVADSGNSTIRRISTASGQVTTIAGLAGVPGATDGFGTASRLRAPSGIVYDPAGILYVADFQTSSIRMITLANGYVSTFAGLSGSAGATDGFRTVARFQNPQGIARDNSGNLFVADNRNHTIRRIVIATGQVTTLAGLAGNPGTADGTGTAARFSGPTAVAADAAGNVYVADIRNYTIRKIAVSTGQTTTIAGLAGTSAYLDGVGTASRLYLPWALALDLAGNLLIGDGPVLRRMVLSTGQVTTIGGLPEPGAVGSADGTGTAGRFNHPLMGLTVDTGGNVFAVDSNNHCIRKGSPALPDVATIDESAGFIRVPRQLDTFPQTAVAWVWRQTVRPPGSLTTLSSTSIRNPTFTPDVPGRYEFELVAVGATGISITRVELEVTTSYCLSSSAVPIEGGTVTAGYEPIFQCNPASLGGGYPAGINVDLTAAPAPGWAFAGWIGDLDAEARSSNPVTVLMDRSRSISASFVRQGSLSGWIGVKEGSRIWRLNGPEVQSVEVAARNLATGVVTTSYTTQGAYEFVGLPSGSYSLAVTVNYRELVQTTATVRGCWYTATLPVFKSARRRFPDVVFSGSTVVQNLTFPPPVAMVHGVWSCFSSKWLDTGHIDDSTSGRWDPWARVVGELGGSETAPLGFLSFTPDYNYDMDTSRWSIEAGSLESQIRADLKGLFAEATDENLPPWYYIGHSQGGLMARALVNTFPPYKSALTQSLRKIYLLGTPNSGSDWPGAAKYAGIGKYLGPEAIRQDFNVWWRGVQGKTVEVFAGNDGPGWGTSSDGSVEVDSVYNVIQKFCPNGQCVESTVLTFPGSTVYFGHMQLGDPDTRDALLTQRILPDILVDAGAIVSARTKASAVQQAETSSTLLSVPRDLAAGQITVPAGPYQQIPFAVGVADSVIVRATVLSGSASISLVSPGGVVPVSSILSAGGWHEINELGEFFGYPSPAPGSWALRITPGGGGATIDWGAQESSPVRFEASFRKTTAAVGESVGLRGQITTRSGSVSGLVVTATIRNDAGASVGSVTLYDDGAHQDGSAGDGVFGGSTPSLASSGRYSADLEATGFFSGSLFSRIAGSFVDVLPAGHALNGSFTDTAVDVDDDGFFEVLRESIGVSLPAAGSYLVSADLTDAAGYPVAHGTRAMTVPGAGLVSIAVDFDLSQTPCAQFTSSFKVVNVTVGDGNFKTFDIWTGPISTQSYRGATFGCTAATPGPQVSAVSPSTLRPGQTAGVVVSGSGFLAGAQLSLGAGVTLTNVSAFGSVLTATAAVSAGASLGTRSATVTNTDTRSATLAGGFAIVSDQPPTVLIGSPSGTQAVSVPVNVGATVSDDLGIQRVEFFVDGVLKATDTAFPYAFSWNPGSVWKSSSYVVTARAYDTSGQMGASAPVGLAVKPQATVSGGGVVCAGSPAMIQATLTGSGPVSITWSDGLTQTGIVNSLAARLVSPSSFTSYTVSSISNAGGTGTSSGSATVVVNPTPARPEISALSPVGSDSPNRVASVVDHPGSSYAWTLTNGTITSGQGTSRLQWTSGETGTASLRVVETNSLGCRSQQAAMGVTVLDARSAIQFYPVPPCRVFDTRGPSGPRGGPGLGAGESRSFVAAGICGIPSGARSLSLNLTVTNAAATGFMTLFPSDQAMPLASAISFAAGRTRGNNGTAVVSQDGTVGFTIFNGSAGFADVIVDVNGYFQ